MSRRKSRKKDDYIIKLFLGILLISIVFAIAEQFPYILLLILFFPVYKIVSYVTDKIATKKFKIQQLQRTQTVQSIISEFHTNPYEFEGYVAQLFEYRGYSTKLTPKSNDGGKDIVMTKNGNKCVVEVKLYTIGNKIGREKIQKLHSAMMTSNANYAYFVTTSDFTTNAIEYAKQCGIRLINGDVLAKMVQETNQMLISNNR